MHIIWAILAVGGLIAAGALKTGNEFIDNLKFHINPLKLPKLSFSQVEFPITIKVDNPSAVGIKLDSLFVNLFKKEGGAWKPVANSRPDLINLDIKKQATTTFDLILTSSTLSAASNLTNILQNIGSNQFKVEANIRIGGKTIRQESIMTV